MNDYSYENVKNLVESSYTRSDVIGKFNLRISSSSYRTINYYLKLYDLKNNFLKPPVKIKIKKTTAMPLDNFINKYLIINSPMTASRTKEHLLKFSLKINKCEICGIDKWHDKKLICQLHHKNGIHNDSRFENLQILCPNCHSQTDTFSGKHRTKQNYCECGATISRKSKLCVPCKNKKMDVPKKIKWPEVDYIINQLKIRPCVSLAKELGVSTVAIIKHLKRKGIDHKSIKNK